MAEGQIHIHREKQYPSPSGPPNAFTNLIEHLKVLYLAMPVFKHFLYSHQEQFTPSVLHTFHRFHQ